MIFLRTILFLASFIFFIGIFYCKAQISTNKEVNNRIAKSGKISNSDYKSLERLSVLEKKDDLFSRFEVGGNIDFSIGNNITIIGLSPTVGYRVTNDLSIGLAFSWKYVDYKIYDVDENIVGLGAYSYYNIFKNIFVSTSFYEINKNYDYRLKDGKLEYERGWIPYLYVGGGIKSKLFGNTVSYVGVRYNLLYDSVRDSLEDPYSFFFNMSYGI